MNTNKSPSASRWTGLQMLLMLLMLACAGPWGSVGAAPTWRSQDTNLNNGTSITLATPSGTVQNDLLLATISTRGGTVARPAGWTPVQQQTQGGVTLAVFYLRYNANTAASHQFTWSNSARAVAAILRYTGVDGLQAIDASAIDTGLSGTTGTAPAITTSVADTTVVRVVGVGGGGYTITSPPDERVNTTVGNANNGTTLAVSDLVRAAAGPTPAADFTWSANEDWVAVTLALRPFTTALCANPPSTGTTTLSGGIYNSYYPGAATAGAGAVSITVGTSTGTGAAIDVGDLLLVIQMQDAAINYTNTANYGGNNGTGSGATNYNNAGKYEFVVAKSAVVTTGGTVQIEGKGPGGGLINTYTNANATNTQGQRRFQVVRVPQYFDANVTGAVTAAPWNGTSGGIVALDAAGTLNFSGGGINVNALGFRGGGGQGLGGGAGANTDYRTRITVNTNGNKAEGVAGSPNSMYYGTGTLVTGTGYPDGTNTDASRARGAPGNAGGGGTDGNPSANDQNSGGGGGGNGGAGGLGGNTWSSNLPRGGFGGAVFPHSAGTLALGGGGGSGARNNSAGVESSGGRGGGIIMVRANSVTGTATLSANGGVGVTPANDGGGGGGAGGSVLVFARSGVLTSLTIAANGANGTNADMGGSPHGPGGGGAGGVVYLSSPAGSASATEGAAGSTVTVGNNFGASPGGVGSTNTTLTEAQIPGVIPGATCKATLASVSRFGATVEGGQVVLNWETAFELGTAGFHLERLDPVLGDYERVNDELLPALIASVQGGSYSYADPDAWPGQTYSYRLVEQEVRGGTRTYGPYTVTPAEPSTKVAVATFQSASQVAASDQDYDDPGRGYRAVAHAEDRARGYRDVVHTEDRARGQRSLARGGGNGDVAAVPMMAAALAVSSSASGDSVQIPVREDGLFYTSAADIAQAVGAAEATAVKWVKRKQLELTTGGQEVAWMPSADNGGIYFYGQSIESLYALDNVYRLRVGQKGETMKGSPAKDKAPDPVAAGTFSDVVTSEQDRFAATVVSTDPGADYWYWQALIGGSDPAWNAKTFTIHLPDVAGDGVVTVFLKGAVMGAHSVRVSVNGQPLGEGNWADLGDYALQRPVTAAQLVSGDNLIEVSALGGTENIFYVDRIAVQYRRLARAVDDRLTLTAEGSGPLAVEGFSTGDIDVFDITDTRTPRHLTAVTVAAGTLGQSVTFDAKPGRRYLALTGAAVMAATPAAMTLADLHAATNRVDYLVIAPPELRDAAQALANYRQDKGLSSRVVGTDEIYDSFNWGVASPEALREFLRHAFGTWGVRYVVLAGVGSFDYRDLGGRGEPQVPTLMTATPNGLFGCDNCLVDFDGDGAPDLPIGRIPAATPADLQDAYLAKVRSYEAGPVALDLAGAMLLADNADPAAGGFSTDSDQVAELLPAGMPVTRIYLDQDAIGTARPALFDGMNQGTGWVNYIGHGGIDRFSSQGLLTVDDMGALLSTGVLPVISALTCAANRFEVPGYAPLGARLAMDADGGAIAVWSPTGLSINGPAVALNRSLFDAVFQQWAPTLGDAIRQALQENTARSDLPAYMLRIYSLIGDPALQLSH